MRIPRRRFLRLAGGAAVLPAVSRIAWAQVYPSRPITMIVPGPAGTATDTIGRLVAERMRSSLGQPIVIENVTGASGSIGTGRAARARPDGYTIVIGFNSSHALNGALYSLRYDVLNDFEPISPLAMGPIIFYARKTMPAKDLNDLIGWLNANPDKASAGIATVGYHLVTALFQKQTGTKFPLLPYRSLPPALQDLVAGRIDLLFGTPDLLPMVRGGIIKAYAVTSDTRFAQAPDIPTFAEMGVPAVFWSTWMGLFAPGARRGTLLANSMPRPWRHWPTGWCDLVSRTSAMTPFHASDKHRRRLPACKRPMPRNGGRSSRSWGSRRSDSRGWPMSAYRFQ
jgi:tripartite-type tricarboxylate transporter receptor subunit TctC